MSADLNPSSPASILDAAEVQRDIKDAAARRHRALTSYYLACAAVALPALMRAAAAGNVTATEAMLDIHKITKPKP